MKKKLTGAEWLSVIQELADVLPPDKQRRVTVIGGVAMILEYGAKRTTDDMDVIILRPDIAEEVQEAALRVTAFGLDAGWLNQRAVEANLIRHPYSADDHVVFANDSLVIAVPSPEHMLAMKLAAYRREKDIRDARLLVDRLRRGGLTEMEDIWTAVGGLVPVAKQATARYNLLDLWDRYFP